MKAVNYLQSVKHRIIEGELSGTESIVIFMFLLSVASICIYIFAPQTLRQ